MTHYYCSLVTMALSRTEFLFSPDAMDLTFQGHQWFPVNVPR